MNLLLSILNFTFLDYVEWTAVALSLTFLYLLIKENKWCWLFGIVSSAMSVYLMYQFKLYSETALYVFYVLIGFYGWYVWGKEKDEVLVVSTWSLLTHIAILIIGGIYSYCLGTFFLTQTDAERTYVDATTSIFSVFASYMEAHKIFSTWVFWILINGVSIWLYYDRGLFVYSAMMVVYFAVSIYGFVDWGKKSGVLFGGA